MKCNSILLSRMNRAAESKLLDYFIELRWWCEWYIYTHIQYI